MPDFSILRSFAPYHIITYGTILGSSIFQSFIAGVVAYKTLPRAQFATLQAAIFPIYFSLQTALPVLLALTYPATKSISGSSQSGLGGFFAVENRYNVLAPIVTTFAINVANLTYIGPQTNKIMRLRKHQEAQQGFWENARNLRESESSRAGRDCMVWSGVVGEITMTMIAIPRDEDLFL
ncbi:MAG: hypothetical protein Q9170_000665 [Blastenia crenularia]